MLNLQQYLCTLRINFKTDIWYFIYDNGEYKLLVDCHRRKNLSFSATDTFDNYEEALMFINYVKQITGKKIIHIFDVETKTVREKI